MVYMVQGRGAKLLGKFLSVFSLGLRIGYVHVFAACAKKMQLVTCDNSWVSLGLVWSLFKVGLEYSCGWFGGC